MKIKLLQLNIYKGKYLNNIISYVKSNNFDILHLQEVAGGQYSFDNHNCFEVLKKSLGLEGELCVDLVLPDNNQSYMGNAILFSNKIIVKDKEIIRFDKYPSPTKIEDIKWDKVPRSIISLSCLINGQPFQLVNTHLVWGPTPFDSPDNIFQGEQLIDHLKSLTIPYVATGDFNVDQRSTIVKNMNKIARNLIQEYAISNTLNPRTHRIKELFPQGLAVDFIYVQKSLKVNNFAVIDSVDLSDHLGLMVEIEI